MKETILSKFKRLAVAMFAAFCVGNVWAVTYAGDSREMSFDVATKTISYRWNCYLTDGAFKDYKLKAVLEYGGSTTTNKVTTKEFVETRWYVMKFDKTLDDFNLGDVLRVTFSLCYGNSDANIDNTWGDDSYSYTIDTRGVLTSDCKWDVDTKKFFVSGKVNNDGVKGVKVKYKVSDAELTELPQDAVVEDAEYDSATGVYNIEIPYVNEKSYLNWSVYAVFENEEKVFVEPAVQTSVLSARQDEDGYIAYTWTGAAGDNLWSNPLNWDEDIKRSFRGVPGYTNMSGHATSSANFTNSATVNLNGGTFCLWPYTGVNAPHRGLKFLKGENESMTVKFTNGKVHIDDDDGDNFYPLLGGDGVTIEFAEGGIYDYKYHLAFAPGTTIIFSGDSNQPWKYNPANKGEGATTFIVRNGNVKSKYGAESVSSTHTAIIENGVWMIDEIVSKGIANVTKFVDGENQARLVCGSTTTGASKELKLTDTFEFKFTEETNYTVPYILAVQLAADSSCTFKVDATDCYKKFRIPLLRVNNLNDNTRNSINAILANPDLLQVVENGRSVKANRRGELVWDETVKTLYYTQDPVIGFKVIVR